MRYQVAAGGFFFHESQGNHPLIVAQDCNPILRDGLMPSVAS